MASVLSEIEVEQVEPAERFADLFHDYRTGLLPMERVRELSVLRPQRAALDTFLCWASLIAAWALVVWNPTWWMVLLAIPLIGSRYYALIIIGHDGLHRRLCKDPKWNDLFNDLFIEGAVGGITRIHNRNHLEHHRHLSTESDPDRFKYGCFNKTNTPEFAGYLSSLTSVWRTVKNIFWKGHSEPARAQAESRSKPRYTLRDVAIIGGWQGMLIGGLTWTIGWWAYPVLWLVPVYVFTFMADNFRTFAEHSLPLPDKEADPHRLITYTSNPIERLFFAPMNMNYHTVHHLWPSIPYYNLPIADAEIRGLSAANGLEWRGSYLAYLWRYSRLLPLPQCKA